MLRQKLLSLSSKVTVGGGIIYWIASRFSVMAEGNPDSKKASTIYEFNALDIDGNEVSLEKYRGHVCIITNVASK
ncbi:Uncharacterised protein r2_g3011 [Pycnogonum litorale]